MTGLRRREPKRNDGKAELGRCDPLAMSRVLVEENTYNLSMPSRDARVRAAESTTNHRTLVIALLAVLAGVLALWAVSSVSFFADRQTLRVLATNIASTGIVTGGLVTLWELKGRRDLLDEVLVKTGLASEISKTGISRASTDWRIVDWNNLISGAREIDVFISYGSTWLSTHRGELEEFASNPKNRLRYILPDPKDAESMSVLAHRYQYTPETIESKVSEAAHTVASISRKGAADVRVWYRAGAPTFTCYRFDATFVVTLYSHTLSRGKVPTLVLDSGTFGDFFAAEMEAVHSQGREVPLNELIGAANED